MLGASAEGTVEAIDRASAGRVFREAIRQVDRAIDGVRAEHRSVSQHEVQAKKLEAGIRERIVDLDEKVRFAFDKGRADLAEAALSSQVDLESRLAQLETAQRDTAAHVDRLDSCLGDLRKQKMEKALRDFEKDRDSARHATAAKRSSAASNAHRLLPIGCS